jgi:hypothetical protein
MSATPDIDRARIGRSPVVGLVRVRSHPYGKAGLNLSASFG